jgi:uncharacterized protein YchJ
MSYLTCCHPFDVDDTPTTPTYHMRDNLTYTAHVSHDFDVDMVHSGFVGQLQEGAGNRVHRIVDQNIDAAQFQSNGCD